MVVKIVQTRRTLALWVVFVVAGVVFTASVFQTYSADWGAISAVLSTAAVLTLRPGKPARV